MVIAFPPCTHLSSSGALYWPQKQKDGRQQAALDFVMMLANCSAPHIAIENPVGILSRLWRKPDQIIEPYHHGDPYRKKTCLWLKNLPLLLPSKPVEPVTTGIMARTSAVGGKTGRAKSERMPAGWHTARKNGAKPSAE